MYFLSLFLQMLLGRFHQAHGILQAKKHKPAAARVPEKTNFHGKHEVDPITKRSWIEPPKGEKRKENEYCYLPKKHIHTWSGHTKGVNAIR